MFVRLEIGIVAQFKRLMINKIALILFLLILVIIKSDTS
jgi:hypothetical protein